MTGWRDWLDRRTGYRQLARHLLDEPIPGGARWAYVFGSGLLSLFLLQAATGLVLAFCYSPSTREAWGSVYHVTHELRLGWFVRGLHHWGASAMLLVLLAHLLQVVLFGAYRAPRELGWWTGLFLLFVVLGFAFTGYLLPWDQHGYWAAREVSGVAATLPGPGRWLAPLLETGDEVGNRTLLRAFGVHVFVLPILLGLVAVAHVALFRRNGVTPSPATTREARSVREPFWPRQAAYDLAFAALLIAAVAAFTWWRHGAPLEAPGDGVVTDYPARPAWYFRWLFELRRSLPAAHEAIGVVVVTSAGTALLALLPVLDRAPSAALRARWRSIGMVLALVGGVATLTARSLLRDAADPDHQRARAAARRAAARAFVLAADGIPPGGASELYLNDPRERGHRLFDAHCAVCHTLDGSGGEAPDLGGYLSRAWVRGVVADPTTPAYFGGTDVTGMEPTDATPAELDLLADYVLSLGGATPAPAGGADLFEEKGCATCHARAGEEPLSGPSLGGYGSPAWIAGVVRTPDAPTYYGESSRMPGFDRKLTNEELDDLIEFLVARK